MNFLSTAWNSLSDERLVANLLAAHAVVLGFLVVSVFMRRLLARGTTQLAHWTHGHWLDPFSKQVTTHARTLLFWLTLGAIAISTVAGVIYHLMGRDIRDDLSTWWHCWTLEDLFHAGLRMGGILATGLITRFVIGCITRIRPVIQRQLLTVLGSHCRQETVQRWFQLLERFAVSCSVLFAGWIVGNLIGLERWADGLVGFFLRVSTILVCARLLILAGPVCSRLLADVGGQHLGRGRLHRYWERITRLFPLGERCFEAAVYITAASLILGELSFIQVVAEFGPRVVECIGIFFITRVLIELSQVLLNEAFGLYSDERIIDQKGRTLVPLLQSICQYVLYFGSFVIMLDQLKIPTAPILAGAGIIGLGVGLGAQSLVTDVVSGFFILFENQYLVGDFVEIGGASGTVEEVSIRVTHIRDNHGKLHIIPNGTIKNVVNYSKGYINAVVDVSVPRGGDLETIFVAMAEAGQRLRKAHREVLDDTEVQGLVELGSSEMKVRAVTRVQPGTHLRMQNEYRRLLKSVLDQKSGTESITRAA